MSASKPVDGARCELVRATHAVRRPARGFIGCTRMLGVLAALGMAFSACAGPDETGSMASRVSAWADTARFGSEAAGLVSDISRVKVVLERRDAGAVRADCAVLSQDAEAAHQELPTPDASLTDLLDAAYRQAFDAAEYCYEGAGGDPRQIALFERSASVAESDLASAKAELRSLEAER